MFCFKKILKYKRDYYDIDRKCLDRYIKSNIVTIKDIIKAWFFDINDIEFRFYPSISSKEPKLIFFYCLKFIN